MSIREEAPEVFEIMVKLDALGKSLGEIDGATAMRAAEDPKSTFSTYLLETRQLLEQARVKIDAHALSPAVQDRFFENVEGLMRDPRYVRARVHVTLDRLLVPRGYPADWFVCHIGGKGDVLDTSIHIIVLHPELLRLAKRKWGGNKKITFSIVPREDGGSYDEERVNKLEEHGIPGDTSTWFWAYEALDVAEKALQCLSLEFRLCDYVEWTCTGEPPNMHAGETFGEPMLLTETGFGARLTEDPAFKRLEGCEIWKTENGTYVSPLWEYLGWRGERYDDLAVYARSLAQIGEGIDRAVLMHDPEFDPDGDSRIRLTANSIFRAGEAMMNLRVKFELEDVVAKGVKSDLITQTRSKLGGARSAEARSKRISALLDHMEEVVRENPIVIGLGPEQVAELAIDACIAADPALWSQGRGRVSEYVGEIRRGEAGVDMRDRFFAIFPHPSLKRPPSRAATA